MIDFNRGIFDSDREDRTEREIVHAEMAKSFLVHDVLKLFFNGINGQSDLL
ncbi:hypothetical protein [Daejeonella sp. H1SJ63]|jgi:hypothetical protein|uniref:hypothetical protein n=1 Tax=Daejeonella sp. H1SJ63 TaxID=3034145 RepID=UPI0023EC89FC|nr:hypothetical protein [Daejeonella sp. H1SJ63]